MYTHVHVHAAPHVNVQCICFIVPWLAAYGGHYTQSPAEQLVATSRASQFKVEGVVKLAPVLGAEVQLDLSLPFGWDHPAELHQPASNKQGINQT